MSSRRAVILIAAVVVGALAAFALFQYVGGIEDRANEDARVVEVLVVKQDIPRGLGGDQAASEGFIVRDEINAKYKPITAVNDITTIGAKVAVTNLAAGQVLVEGMFADPIESQITAARRIDSNMVAMTMSFDQVRGVAGLLVPGDFVNILVTLPVPCALIPGEEAPPPAQGSDAPLVQLQPPGSGETPSDDTDVARCRSARYLYQEVQVLFVDKRAIPLPGEQTQTTDASGNAVTGNAGLITFAVPPEAAQVLASVNANDLYLTLLPTDYAPRPLPPLPVYLDALPGEDSGLLTPYGPAGLQDQ